MTSVLVRKESEDRTATARQYHLLSIDSNFVFNFRLQESDIVSLFPVSVPCYKIEIIKSLSHYIQSQLDFSGPLLPSSLHE